MSKKGKDPSAANVPAARTTPTTRTPEVPEVVATPTPPKQPTTLTVRDKGGKNVTIELKPNVVVMMMATWCPHSGPVRDLMKKHKGAAGLDELRVVYVFEDEWPTARDMLARETGTPADQIETQLKVKREAMGGGPLIAPDFLKECDAEIFYVHPDHPLPGKGYPRVVARDGKVQPGNAGQWLNARIDR